MIASIQNPCVNRAPRSAQYAPRSAFTLIELLVSITIIGILSSIALAALSRARQSANVVNTKSTIARLHSQIQSKWDSYRIRKVPIDPNLVLSTMATVPGSYPYVSTWLANWNLGAANPLSNRQVAAVRLLAIRELQRFEMPSSFDDFAVVTGSGGAPYVMRTPNVLASPPSMAYTYLRKLNASSAASVGQLQANEGAECLYMVVTSGLEDVSFGGELSVPKSVGDADGDGLPEFQDAWTLGLQQFPASGPQRQPISWIRWPAGFRNSVLTGITVSDLDADPTQPSPLQFSVADHDYFDPLKVDVPTAAFPRGYGMMPLVFSAGPDGVAGLTTAASPPPVTDPYDLTSGAPTTGWEDNIHNHLIEAR